MHSYLMIKVTHRFFKIQVEQARSFFFGGVYILLVLYWNTFNPSLIIRGSMFDNHVNLDQSKSQCEHVIPWASQAVDAENTINISTLKQLYCMFKAICLLLPNRIHKHAKNHQPQRILRSVYKVVTSFIKIIYKRAVEPCTCESYTQNQTCDQSPVQ